MTKGMKTSEFWVMVLGQVVGLLVMFGVVEPGQGNELRDGASQLIGGGFAVATALGYMGSRAVAKLNGEGG